MRTVDAGTDRDCDRGNLTHSAGQCQYLAVRADDPTKPSEKPGSLSMTVLWRLQNFVKAAGRLHHSHGM